MPIEPHRIEAAARALHDALDIERAVMWAEKGDMCIDGTVTVSHIVTAVLAAAFPELAAGTAWVAPWRLTNAMEEAVDRHAESRGYENWPWPPNAWVAARDAHLSKGKDDDHG